MGTFRYPVEIGDLAAQRFETVEALVDTGAVYSVLPRSVLDRVGVVPYDRIEVIVGDGRVVDWDVGHAWMRVDGKGVITLVAFGEERIGAVLGAYTLEGLGLGVDPVNRRLIPVPRYFLGVRQRRLGRVDPTADAGH